MSFNSTFQSNWTSKFLTIQEAQNLRNQVKNRESTFIFPFLVYTGFQNLSSNGVQVNSAKPQNYAQFSRAFTGKEGVVAIWKDSLKIYQKLGVYEQKDIDLYNTTNKNLLEEEYLIDKVSVLILDAGPIIDKLTWDVSKKLFTGGKILETADLESAKVYVNNNNNNSRILVREENSLITQDYLGKSKQNYYDKEILKGFAFKGRLDNSSSSISFSSAPGQNYIGNYTNWQSVKSYVIDTTNRIYENDLYNLYMVPQITEDKKNDVTLLYISNIEYYYDDNGKFVYNRILFSSLNDSISQTGQSIFQFVQFSAPGEGHARPKLIYDNNENVIDYTFDPEWAVDRGIDTIQIEILGPAYFTTPIIQGRPIEKLGEVNKIYPPRDLLMRDIKYPLADNLTTQSNPESIFYLANAKPEIQSSYSDWKEAMRTDYTDTIIKKFDGWFETDRVAVANSNKNALSLKDVNLTFKDSSVINFDYDVRSLGYFNYQLPDKKIGKDRINPSHNPRARLFDIMNLFTFMFRHIRSLPIESVQKIPWSLSHIPLIGKFLNALTLGIPVGWRQVNNKSDITFPNFLGLPGFMSAPLYNWYDNAFWDVRDKASRNKGKIPLDVFKTDTPDAVGGIIGSSSMSTTFCFRLSDKCSATPYKKSTGATSEQKAISTLYIGQEDKLNKDLVYLVDENLTVLEPNLDNDYITDIKGTNKYIIDLVGFSGIVKAPVRITMFQNDPDQSTNPYQDIVYQTVLQSKSMYTDNVRDLHTIWKLTYLDEFLASQEEFAFPRPLPQPIPNINFENVNVDMSQYNINIDYPSWGKVEWDETYFDKNDTLELYDFARKGLTTQEQVIQVYQNLTFKMNVSAGLNTYFGISPRQNSFVYELNLTEKTYDLNLSDILTEKLLETFEKTFKVSDNDNNNSKSTKTCTTKFYTSFSIVLSGTKLLLKRVYLGIQATGVEKIGSGSRGSTSYQGGRPKFQNSFPSNLDIFTK